VHRIQKSHLILALGVLVLAACRTSPPTVAASDQPRPLAAPQSAASRIIRATGTVQAVRSFTLRVPQLTETANSGRGSQLTLTALVPNGTAAKKGDVLAEFDQTARLDELRDAKAKLNELEHQREEKRAQVDSDSAKRQVVIREAEVELGKAEIQLQKGPVLADLDRQKNEVKAASARERLTTLNNAHQHWLKSETAAVRVLELKCERQKLVVDRLQMNLEKLTVHAPHDGMIAYENVWRNGSMGPPQVGDQMWSNQPVLRIFDPNEMIIDTQVNESDAAVLGTLAGATVYLDAYPTAKFYARLENASPVATAGLESPVRNFSARFRIEQSDARLLPDLSASLEIAAGGAAPEARK
jgi:hypothetical protein